MVKYASNYSWLLKKDTWILYIIHGPSEFNIAWKHNKRRITEDRKFELWALIDVLFMFALRDLEPGLWPGPRIVSKTVVNCNVSFCYIFLYIFWILSCVPIKPPVLSRSAIIYASLVYNGLPMFVENLSLAPGIFIHGVLLVSDLCRPRW